MSVAVPGRRPSPARMAGFAALLAAVTWGLAAFSAWPWAATPPDAAALRLSLRHVSAFTTAARAPTAEELARLPAHMRPRAGARGGTGRRADAVLTVVVDGRTALARRYRPTGLRHDGPVHAFEEVSLAPGRHAVEVTLADAVADDGARRDDGAADAHDDGRGAEASGDGHHRRRRWRLVTEIEIPPGRAPLLEFSDAAGWRLH